MSNVSWDCLPPCPNVWSLPVSDQVSFCHALSHSVLHFVKTRAQQQQTNNNKQTWKHFAFKMVHCRFSRGFARNRSNLEITRMRCQHLPWQQIASGKMWPKSCQGLSSFSRVGSCHLYFSLFGFWFMIEDCQLVAKLLSHNHRPKTPYFMFPHSGIRNMVQIPPTATTLGEWTIEWPKNKCAIGLQEKHTIIRFDNVWTR